MGDYSGSLEAISRSWKLLSSGSNPNLALKLSTRTAKALSQGVRGGSISTDFLRQHVQVIEQLEVISKQQQTVGNSGDSEIPEHVRVWREWGLIDGEPSDRKEAALQAHRRLSRLPVFKKSL